MLLNENDCNIIEKLPRAQNPSEIVEQEGNSRSNLTVTYEDGTTEENIFDVTSLRFSTIDDKPLTIGEIENIDFEQSQTIEIFCMTIGMTKRNSITRCRDSLLYPLACL